MNNLPEKETRYRLLKILAEKPRMGQREMARHMGISLGKVNYCLSELASKGFIKINRFKSAKNKIPYAYVLTPRGLEEKGRVTVAFLKRRIAEYEAIRAQIQELSQEVGAEQTVGWQGLERIEVGALGE